MLDFSNIIAIDVETTGLNPWTDKLLGLSVATATREDYYPWGGKDAIFPFPWDLLADPTLTKIGHNLRFDLKFLKVNGVDVVGPFGDTKLMAQLVDENQSLSLKPLSTKYLPGTPLKYEKQLKQHLAKLKLDMGNLSDPRVDQNLVALYCNEDTRNTLALAHKFYELLSPQELAYYTEEMLPLEDVLLDMELRGNLIDLKKMAEAKTMLLTRIETYTTQLNALVAPEMEVIAQELWIKERDKKKTQKGKDGVLKPEFNWSSGPQKVKLFYGLLNLGKYCHELTDTGAPSLKRSVLEKLTLPEGKLKMAIDAQIKLQSYEKMHSAYIVGLESRLVDDRIHGEYHQASREDFKSHDDEGGTVTGRLSHRNPNLGNLPRKAKESDPSFDYWRGTFVKDLFIPPVDMAFVYADYSQIELRVAAHLSQDPTLLYAFRQGVDPHTQTAELLGISRQQGKTVNFLLIYFGSAWRLCIQLGWDPQNDAQLRQAEHIRDNFFDRYPVLKGWIHEQRRFVKDKGYVVSMFGRKRRLPEIWGSTKGEVNHALKQAGNFVVQSVAASITKRAMIQLAPHMKIVNQVHDSITALSTIEDAPKNLEIMKRIMQEAVTLSIPLDVDAKIITTFKE